MTGYSSIPVYYKTMFSMMQHHKYSMSDWNDMYPYERDLFIDMLANYIEEQNQKNQ